MLKRLRLKFVCITMLIVTVMLCVIFGTIFHFTRQSLERESLETMKSIGNDPISIFLPELYSSDVRMPYFVLQIGMNGSILSAGGEYYSLTDGNLTELLDAVYASPDSTGVISEYNLRYYRVSTLSGQRIVFADMSSEQTVLRRLAGTCVLIGAGSLAVFLVLSLLLARWAVRPVEDAWKQQRQFVDDASHELKTPLTVILTNAELLREQDSDAAARARFTDSILVMAHQMRGLVESLLELARVDNGRVHTEMAKLDLSALVSDAVLPFEPLCYEQGLTCSCDIEPEIFVNGSEDRLRQISDILLDNAIKYSSSGGEVWVRLKKQRQHAVFSVENTGDPIAPEDLKNIFKRFYRADRARSMDHSYGLGLSIAEGIVKEHRGRIWAESENGVNVFFVELPLS